MHLRDLGDDDAARSFLESSADMIATALRPEGGPDARPGLVQRWSADLQGAGRRSLIRRVAERVWLEATRFARRVEEAGQAPR